MGLPEKIYNLIYDPFQEDNYTIDEIRNDIKSSKGIGYILEVLILFDNKEAKTLILELIHILEKTEG